MHKYMCLFCKISRILSIGMSQDYDYDYDQYQAGEEVNNEEDYSMVDESESFQPEYQPEVVGNGNNEGYVIVHLLTVWNQLEAAIIDIQGLTCLPPGWCLLLLKNFNWDINVLREKFYENQQQYLNQIGYSPYLENPLDFSKNQLGDCEVCLSQKVPLYSNICNHSFCLECWTSSIGSNVQSASCFSRCLKEGCYRPLLLETVRGLLLLAGQQGDRIFKKYEKKLCELFITSSRQYQFCTGTDCNHCIKLLGGFLEAVKCVCGKVFCFRCQSDDHYPCDCTQKAKWIQQVLKEQADAKWISNNAKVCPHCHKAVERSMGCNYMKCTCGLAFCYMCSKPWEPDHKDHFKCHLYKKRPDQQINKEKEIMERMNHCTERFVFNQAVANTYKAIDVFAKRKTLYDKLRISLTDSEFMDHAFKFAIECCQKIKWIYAFTYFYRIAKPEIKQAFDYSLGEYERYKENLLKLLAVDLKSIFQEAESGKVQSFQIIEKFESIKKQTVNLYTCTKNYKEKFLLELNSLTDKMDEKGIVVRNNN